MENDTAYHMQRRALLAANLKWMLETQQVGLELGDLVSRLDLGEWEVQHLFQEYLGKDPVRLVQAAFLPSLAHVQQQVQLSFFDQVSEAEEVSPLRPVIDVDISLLTVDPEVIRYMFCTHFLGKVFIASSDEGICQITFEDAENGRERLKKTYPKSLLQEESTVLNELTNTALNRFFVAGTDAEIPVIPVAVKATPFQRSVWNELLNIPFGTLNTYGGLAELLGDPKASRAVGTAVGANPIALLIPCHRVVHQSGKIGHFRWGRWRKQLLLAIEKGAL